MKTVMKWLNSVFLHLLGILPNEILIPKESTNRECPLCGDSLKMEDELNLCSECIKSVDCCIGLEKIRE